MKPIKQFNALEGKEKSHGLTSYLTTPDINECRQRVCRSDQQCKNTRGGYTCIDLCPNGMTKGANGTCVGEYSQYLRDKAFTRFIVVSH